MASWLALFPLLQGAPAVQDPSARWALQPVVRPALPEVQAPPGWNGNPVDAFVFARLREAGLSPSPTADRGTLVRRVTFDLTGLPPSPEETDAFGRDRRPDAYERLVDRLLASPRHGERWARHWLDVVRFTESQGFEYDRLRDNAWPYRDYVVRSFNADKPYDLFMREQIAGDVIEPVTTDGIIATSLLVCGAWDQAGNSQANATQRAITREEEMEDLVSVVGQTFLGLTINCARCHDHKFDPVPAADYYRVKAVFDGVRHGERPVEDADGARSRESVRAKAQADLAAALAAIAGIESEGAHLDAGQHRARADALARAKAARETIAAASKPGVMAYAGKREQPAPTRALKRGDVKDPGDIVAPSGLSAIASLPADLGLAPDAPEAERRLRFAAWLADPRNPLPARVMVNRVWQAHFGQGLIATPSDLGASGARPSHPELLDRLASDLVAGGWSLKALHRIIVTSAAYRQSSAPRPEAAAQDAENVLLWRFPPRRLEAEAVRDSMLAVSGDLNLQLGGPSFRPFTTSDYGATFYHLFDKGDAENNRRTVYRMNIHSGKEPLLDAFDCPDPSVKTPRRGITTTPLQALGLMNSSFVQRQAGGLAERSRRLARGDLPRAVGTAYRLALGRDATPDEQARAVAAARERGLANVCWVLLNSTEFVYVR